jgi:hypothetical protein
VRTYTMCFSAINASQKAVTDAGEIVILNDDGTWEYADQNAGISKIITNNKVFTKSQDASFLLKSKRNNSAFWINPKKWSFEKGEKPDTDAEYQFQLKDGDLYAMAITEKIEMPLESLIDVALTNAQSVAPDAKVTTLEYRVVNNNKVIFMEIIGTLKGVKFTYRGYYYSDPSGSTQLLAYTSSNLIDTYKSEIEDFLNGFVTN